MLHNRLFLGVCVLFGFIADAFAGSSNVTAIVSGWNSGGNANNVSISNSDFILGGCLNSTWNADCKGSSDDEGAIIVNMARKINNNGGYFCPTQIQMGNTDCKTKIWVNFYKPDNAAGCRWICKSGYTGDNCSIPTTAQDACATSNMNELNKGSIGTSRVNTSIDVFAKSEHSSDDSDRNASVTVLAILAYRQHGVVVGRLKVNGVRDYGCWASWVGFSFSNVKEEHSWVTDVSVPTEKFLLCDTGFKPNAAGNDCEPVDRAVCGLPPSPMCSGWTQEEYKANEGELEYRKIGNCWQYRCQDRNKAFPSADKRVCVDCSTGIRGGATKDTGVCKKCDLGQYFDEDVGVCKTASGLSKSDLQYGKGKSSADNVKEQCWTFTDPDKYKECVMGNTSKPGGNDAVVTSGVLLKANINDVIKNKALGEWQQTHQSAAAPDIH